MMILSGQGGQPTAILILVLAGGSGLTLPRLDLLAPEIIFQFKLGQCLIGKLPGARADSEPSVAANVENLGAKWKCQHVARRRIGRSPYGVFDVVQYGAYSGPHFGTTPVLNFADFTRQYHSADILKISALRLDE